MLKSLVKLEFNKKILKRKIKINVHEFAVPPALDRLRDSEPQSKKMTFGSNFLKLQILIFFLNNDLYSASVIFQTKHDRLISFQKESPLSVSFLKEKAFEETSSSAQVFRKEKMNILTKHIHFLI